MTATSLGRLFVSGRQTAAPVAFRNDVALAFDHFAADVAHAADAVRAARVARGAVLSADPYRFLVGLFGLMHAGATVVLPPDALPATLASLRDEFDLLLCDEPAAAPVPALPIEEGRRRAVLRSAFDPTSAMLEFFTSGSTGAPKRIVKPLAVIDDEIAMLESVWGEAMACRAVMATVPYRHIYGLTFHLLWPLAGGRPFVSHVDDLWENLLARGVTDSVLITSPAHLIRLTGLSALPQGRRPALVFTAGAPLAAAQAREAAAVLGVPPVEMFGSTETGAIATRIQHAGDEPWTALPGVELRTDDTGRMVVQSPFGTRGVPCVTADRIELAPDGRFYFLGRDDGIAKIEGKRVSLARLEQALVALPPVTDAAAVVIGGVSERLAAAVVLNREGQMQLDMLGSFRFSRELRQQLAQQFESAWLPKSWRFVDALPHGAMGKRRDADIKALFLARRARRP